MADRITQFSNDGYTFDVIDSGPIDGTPVVLLHGFPQRASSWDPVTSLLHEQGLRTYAFDQRGYSPGARPRKVRDYRIEALIGDVVALVEQIGSPVHLVGHDWGAAVGWGVPMVRADLIRTFTAVSVGHPRAFLRSMPRGQVLRSYYMPLFSLPASDKVLASRFGHAMLLKNGMTEEMYATYRRDIVEYGALVGGLNWYRAIPFLVTAKITPITVPTTLVWSNGDSALGRLQADLSAEYVDAPYDLAVIDAATHWLPDERPDEVAEAIVARVRSV